ncbi:MAG: hypothetical protein WCD89_19585 [Anaerocolumna sp.]
MSKILFVNGNLHGHFNPMLPVVAELVRGEKRYGSRIFSERYHEYTGNSLQQFFCHE